VLPFAFAVLSLVLAAAGLALLLVRRRRDLGLASFVLCIALYGARLLAATRAVGLLFGVSPAAAASFRVLVTYLIPIPFLLFCRSLLSGRYRALLGWLLSVNAAFALVALPWEWIAGRPGALARANSLLVLVTFALVLAAVLRAGAATWELRRLRASSLVAGFFIAAENLRGLGLLPWPQGLEPLGLFLFLLGLGTIVAHRVFAGEARLAAVSRELETARRIQASILPRELPRVAGLELAVRYVPAEDVAGDFYDFLPGGGRRLGVLVADVSGHGVPAALIASMIQVAAAAQAEHAASPARVLSGMNRIFHGKLRDQFITAAYVFVDLDAGRLTWANAGHPPPLLATAGGVAELAPTGILMGRLSRADYAERSLPIAPGDRLLLFTDGIPECPSPAGELFGDARLQAFVAERDGLAPEPLAAALLDRLGRWSGAAGERGLADDLTLVVLRVA
jgi:sigma-B regulation protein RsbU (phosphoserine phosphatase)